MTDVGVGIRDGRWRLLGAVAIMLVTVLAVVLTRGTGKPQAPPAPSTVGGLGVTDAAFLQLTISIDDSALALFVLLQNDSPALAALAGQLADSHRAELRDLRAVLSYGGVAEDSSIHRGQKVPGIISGDDLVAVHQAPAADRDALAIQLLYQHLTQGALVARGEEQSGTTAAAKALAVRIQRARTAQLTLLTALPTA